MAERLAGEPTDAGLQGKGDDITFIAIGGKIRLDFLDAAD